MSTDGAPRILGTLGTADGKGVVTMRDRFDTDIDDLWSALTDPARLARWLGTFDGELKLGGQARAHYFASGWEGVMTVTECDPPRHFTCVDADGGITEAWLTPDGDGTVLVVEERGMPIDALKDYGAGIQVHIEDLISYLAGGERVDAGATWQALVPHYEELAAPFLRA